MKKTLISLAVLAASTGAFAQSSVTLYGTADAGVGKLAGGKVRMQANTFVNTSDSFLGFRGTEDLGGGLKAGFQFEQGINLRDGSTDDKSTNLTNSSWQRQANLWLGGNWGTFRLGRAYTPSYNALAAWELTGGANNSIAINTFGPVGGEAERRNRSQISYKTPNFGGFAAELGYVFKSDNGGNAKVDLGLSYINGPLRAGVSYNKTKSLKANYALGAQYQFGMFALAAGYHNSANGIYFDDTTGAQIPGAVSRGRGFSLGGKVNFGAASILVDVARETKVDYAVNGVKYKGEKRTNGLVEGRYAFSKRTFVYANYVRFDKGNNYGIGMRHNF
ncbi:porin [Ottowia sp. GY511]|uniref:Porin n=1 Tax=Ottowia flava TaxID=2675430 RepID=A0ABW4KWH5_9BURK|nr:porin [Ottowia sp. GY511]TXK21974.1 porin [Ottowia sp. GY511]